MRRTVPHLAVALVVGALYMAGGLDFLEHRLLDLRFRLSRRPASSEVVVVSIDAHSLQASEVWPWPRSYHAAALGNLLRAGARRVAFDMDLSTPSVDEQDAALARALAASGQRVILPVYRQFPQDRLPGSEPISTEPLPAFRDHVSLAAVDLRPGRDGLVRVYRTGDIVPGSGLKSLATELADISPQQIERFGVDFGIDVASIPQLSYVDVVQGQFDPSIVEGRAVIVGATATELADEVPVPVLATMPRPLFQALSFESLLQRRALFRVPPLVILSVTLLLGLLAGWAFERFSWTTGPTLLLGLLTGCFLLPLLVQKATPILVETSPWALALAGSYVSSLVRRVNQQAHHLVHQSSHVRHSESMMRHVVESSLDAIITVNEAGTIETVNATAVRVFEYSPRDVIGEPVARLILGGFPLDASSVSADRKKPEQRVGQRKNGEKFPVEMVVTRLPRDDRYVWVGFVRDITERKAQEKALKHQATHDALTGLPNRMLLQERLTEALERPRGRIKPLAFMILDLDRFKEINDTLGHHVGDEILRIIAQRLRSRLRPTETIARLGGDEFGVLLPGTISEHALTAAHRLADALAEPLEVEGLTLHIDTSIGISLHPDHGADATAIIQRAEVAMYVAKKDKVVVSIYKTEHDVNSVRQLTLSGELKRALPEDGLVLYYQPKVSTRRDRIEGVEALIRWPHPEQGMLFPDSFITMAEQTGLIAPLTRWVLRESMRQAARWNAEGFPLTVSVNLSARNLMEDDLPRVISQLLSDSGLRGRHITLEITESAIVDDPKRALEAITELVALGVKISIDDFGTGYSSLGYLKDFPASELKIDKSFVMGMERNQANAVIVRSTIDLAHNLGMHAVAEGVDSESAWGLLRSLDCDFGQGFYFSKPVPANTLTEWMTTSPWKRESALKKAAVPEPSMV
jgi:diguanylate cyclase (GGDEF)-like protein/PAS domain S-box-containing protein